VRSLGLACAFIAAVSTTSACGLSVEGMLEREGVPSTDDGADAGARANDAARSGEGDAQDPCVACGHGAPTPGSDAMAGLADDASPGDPPDDASSPLEYGDPDAAPTDVDAATPSCVNGGVLCPLLAVPCCTKPASSHYGACTPIALCGL
jgi:hypothetical protein